MTLRNNLSPKTFYSRINKSLLVFNIELVWPQKRDGRIEKDFRCTRRELKHELQHVYQAPHTWIYSAGNTGIWIQIQMKFVDTFLWLWLPTPFFYRYTSTVFVCRGADKSLVRPTSGCILFDGENTSFDASLVTHINITNIPPIMIIKGYMNIKIFCRCSWFPSWSG